MRQRRWLKFALYLAGWTLAAFVFAAQHYVGYGGEMAVVHLHGRDHRAGRDMPDDGGDRGIVDELLRDLSGGRTVGAIVSLFHHELVAAPSSGVVDFFQREFDPEARVPSVTQLPRSRRGNRVWRAALVAWRARRGYKE